MVGEIGYRSNVKNETNNIQFNNLVISKERLNALCPSQVRKIEEILSESYNLQKRIHE
jgi:hypothetical protein